MLEAMLEQIRVIQSSMDDLDRKQKSVKATWTTERWQNQNIRN